jgi:hypothetical protein
MNISLLEYKEGVTSSNFFYHFHAIFNLTGGSHYGILKRLNPLEARSKL